MDILKVIKRHGHTTYTVAKAIGVKQSSISNMINGNPTVSTLRKIAEAAGCSVAEFFEDEGPSTGSGTACPSTGSGTAVGVIVCPHCGAGIAVTAVAKVE